MKDYIIVNTHHHHELEAEVNKFMKLGYTPIGNPYIAPDNRLSQAMILTNRQYESQDVIKVAKVRKNTKGESK